MLQRTVGTEEDMRDMRHGKVVAEVEDARHQQEPLLSKCAR
jgi:hypothetical protein